MRRSILIAWLGLAFGLVCLVIASGSLPFAAASARSPLGTTASLTTSVPHTSCVYTPLTFSLFGIGTVEDRHPFSTTVGTTYTQFAPAPPLTTTSASVGYLLMNNTFTGT